MHLIFFNRAFIVVFFWSWLFGFNTTLLNEWTFLARLKTRQCIRRLGLKKKPTKHFIAHHIPEGLDHSTETSLVFKCIGKHWQFATALGRALFAIDS